MPYSVSSKGQVTLPLEIRKRLGIKAGDKVDFPVKDGTVTVVPVRGEENPFKDWIGAFPAFKSRQEILDYYSDLRGRDPKEEEGW
jgi:AbrB family looped-hinge helix DNA binding protein